MPNIGPMELIVVLAIALLVLGPKRLPSAGRALGQGIREFKDTLSGNTDPEPQPTPQPDPAYVEDLERADPRPLQLERHR